MPGAELCRGHEHECGTIGLRGDGQTAESAVRVRCGRAVGIGGCACRHRHPRCLAFAQQPGIGIVHQTFQGQDGERRAGPAWLHGTDRAGVAVAGVCILLVARESVAGRVVGGGLQRIGITRRPWGEGRAFVGNGGLGGVHRPVLADGGSGPGFGATGDDDVGLTRQDACCCQGDCIQPRAALGVHREGGAALWQAGCQRCHACRVAAGTQCVAQDQGVHRLRRQPDRLQQMLHQGGGQRVWCVMAQRTMTRCNRGAAPGQERNGQRGRHQGRVRVAPSSAWRRAARSVLPLAVIGHLPRQRHQWRGTL